MIDNPPDDLDGLRRIVEDDAAAKPDRILAADAILHEIIRVCRETPDGFGETEAQAYNAVMAWHRGDLE